MRYIISHLQPRRAPIVGLAHVVGTRVFATGVAVISYVEGDQAPLG